MKPMKYKQVFAVLYRVSGRPDEQWRDWGGRDTWMAQCEKKEKLAVEHPRYDFRVLHEKLIDKKGEVAA